MADLTNTETWLGTAARRAEFARTKAESSHLFILQDRIQAMSRLLLEGGGLRIFLDELERMLGNPAAIVQLSSVPLLSASLRNELGPSAEQLEKLLEVAETGASESPGFLNQPFAPWLSGEGSTGQPVRVYSANIPMRTRRPAFLLLLEANRPITPEDVLTAERMSSLAGLELMNADAVHEVESKYVAQFIEDWLSGKLLSGEDVAVRAEVCGCRLEPDVPLQAAVVGWDSAKPGDRMQAMADAIRRAKFCGRSFVLAALYEGDLVLIFSAVPKADEAFVSELRALCGPEIKSLYIGTAAEHPGEIHASLTDARRARRASEICKLQRELVPYDELGIYRLLYLIPRGVEWKSVMERYIGPLLAGDRKGGRLLETLEAYFRCNGNIRLTSEVLYTHYNTVVYRLEKVEQLLAVDLDDPEVRLQLQLALKMHYMQAGS